MDRQGSAGGARGGGGEGREEGGFGPLFKKLSMSLGAITKL